MTRPDCTKCGGSGSEGFISFLRCGRCGGSGKEPANALIPHSEELILIAGTKDIKSENLKEDAEIAKKVIEQSSNKVESAVAELQRQSVTACVPPRQNPYDYQHRLETPQPKSHEEILHSTQFIDINLSPNSIVEKIIGLDFVWKLDIGNYDIAINSIIVEADYKYLITISYESVPIVENYYNKIGLPFDTKGTILHPFSTKDMLCKFQNLNLHVEAEDGCIKDRVIITFIYELKAKLSHYGQLYNYGR